ncbi:phosphoglycolate phosphatase [Chthonobacter albigriseus]|uniref:phosphoglycolate phosphatase n=1 Tax=Chthonobacter albigriseus TaxID=1683161 RepID=UPI0015EF6FBA|nr:phosphoglycolate phosphatase [Chthonobacter albigriseus]
MTAPLLVLDLDGTLLDTAPDLLGALNAVLAEERLPTVDRSALTTNFGQGARSLIVEGFRRAGAALAVERIDDLVARFIEIYAGRLASETVPFPGAVQALDRLQARGIRLAVCTNKRVHLAVPLLASLGLAHRFAAILGGDSLPVRKPHPDHLIGTVEAAGGLVGASVMVGDSDADIAAAKGAGIPVIGVSFGYTPEPIGALGPDAVIDHFDAIDEALAAISPAFADALA